MKVQFVTSAKDNLGLPAADRPEVAVVGRSNAGKSSFLNVLFNQKLARVSQKPGKTRLLQYFSVGEDFYVVDMPGYGYATGSRDEVASWKQMIESYLLGRETLKGVLLIMDIRRPWSQDEQSLADWFDLHKIRWAVLLSKSDKLSRSAVLKKVVEIEKASKSKAVFAASMLKKTGIDPIKEMLFEEWKK